MSGRGRTTRTERSSIGIRKSRASRSPGKTTDVYPCGGSARSGQRFARIRCPENNEQENKTMSYRIDAKHEVSRAQRLPIATLVLACAAAAVPVAHAQKLMSPATPAIITPPAGNSAFLL